MNKNISSLTKIECTGCRACQMVCPKDCITMERDKEGFFYPVVNEKKCVSCGICLKVCTDDKNRIYNIRESECYAAYAQNREDRETGSSGGIFYLLAKEVLIQKGVVFGASFNESFGVKHKAVRKIEELLDICGSKYVQSDIGDCFKQVEQELHKNRLVLFCGTPCQITGLLNYLGGKNDNLICVSLICHGVPSETVWIKFLSDIECDFDLKEYEINNIRFRKKIGEKQFFEIKTQTMSMTQFYTDIPFMDGFLKNYYLRPSCYACREKGIHSSADIIIGDFWGIDRIDKELDNINAVSACLLQTKKGKEIFLKIKEIERKQYQYNDIINGNSALEKSSFVDEGTRKYFFLKFFENINSLSACIKYTDKYDKKQKEKRMSTGGKKPNRFKDIKQYKYVLWGVGRCFDENIDKILNQYDISFVCDNNEKNWKKIFNGLRCESPEKLYKIENPFVIIMVKDAFFGFQIANQLLDMGISNFDLFGNWITYSGII